MKTTEELQAEYSILAAVADAGKLSTLEVLVRGLDVATGRYLRIGGALSLVQNEFGEACYEMTSEGWERVGELRDQLYEALNWGK